MKRKYTYNMQTFHNLDATTYYLLGAFYTDGNVRIRPGEYGDRGTVSIASKDKDWIDIINPLIINSNENISRKGKNCWEACYYSLELTNWFIEHGCVPNKSLTLQMPIDIPVEYEFDFLRGVWDGDGTICFNRRYRKDRQVFETDRKANLSSGSNQFVEGVSCLLSEDNIKHRVVERVSKDRYIEGRFVAGGKPNYELAISSGEDIYNLLKLMYKDDPALAMPRKKRKAMELIADWERSILCSICGMELDIAKDSRHAKYCDTCWDQKEKERGKKRSQIKREQNALKKQEALNSTLPSSSF